MLEIGFNERGRVAVGGRLDVAESPQVQKLLDAVAFSRLVQIKRAR